MRNLPAAPPSTTTARLVTILGFVIATAVLYLAKEILIPIALAVLISFLLFPLVFWMERRGLKRVFAVVLTVLVLMGIVGGIGYMIAGQFVEFVDNLPSYRTNIVQKIHAIRPGNESVFKRAEAAIEDISRDVEAQTTGSVVGGRTTGATTRSTGPVNVTKPISAVSDSEEPEPNSGEQELQQVLHGEQDALESEDQPALEIIAEAQTGGGSFQGDAVPVQVVEGPPNTWQTFQDIVGPAVTILGNAGLVILFVIFFLLQREDLRDRVLRLAGQNQVRVTTEALEEAATRVSRYLLMQFIINVTYGIPVAIGLWFIGVPNALLWGALATILRFIPYIGPWIAAAMPVALSLAVFDNWTMPLLTIGLFILLEVISNNVMEPVLYGHTTGVSPVAIIVSAVFWTWLWGAVGLVLATPMTVCLVVLGRHIPQLAFLRVLLGDEPVLTDDARVYNRLLSGATDEAVDIAEEYIESHKLEELYDDVLLPTLESAETDRSQEFLSAKRYERLITGINELIDTVTDKYRHTGVKGDEDAEEIEGTTVEDESASEPSLPMRRIVCIPVNDATDEAAAQMLRQLLVGKECEVEVLKSGLLVSEVVEAIREFKPSTVILSSVPPFAVTHTRYIAKRLSADFPDVKLQAGLWRGKQSLEKVDERLKIAGVTAIYTSLSDAALHV